ncbi:uncharacterized protein LOC130282863 [Hyla sarda]|uniref:uncharacterized protein LOC130282863 n=1 Tax=Hyla sarda TaxID=327740 RepID=UPI0024C3A433|nr:uncharacterized protein LOC130282863 [Hyla sarda]
MFSQSNNSNTSETTCHNPPPYNEISPSPIWTISLAPSNQAWDDNALPPAYHTLSNVPLVNVPLPASQFNSPPTNEQWSMMTPRPTYTNPSTTQATAVHSQQFSIETPAPSHNNNSTSSWSNYDDHSQNLGIIPETQGTTLSVLEKRFRRRKMNIIGGSIILTAVAQIIVSLSLLYNTESKLASYGTAYWTSAIYIITGYILLVTKRKPTTHLVCSSVVFNIMTWISCATSLALAVIDLGEFKKLCFINACYTYSQLSPYYYTLIAMNSLVLLLSLPAGLIGITALSSHSKDNS